MTLAEESIADLLAIGAEAKLREAARLRELAARMEAKALPVLVAFWVRNAWLPPGAPRHPDGREG